MRTLLTTLTALALLTLTTGCDTELQQPPTADSATSVQVMALEEASAVESVRPVLEAFGPDDLGIFASPGLYKHFHQLTPFEGAPVYAIMATTEPSTDGLSSALVAIYNADHGYYLGGYAVVTDELAGVADVYTAGATGVETIEFNDAELTVPTFERTVELARQKTLAPDVHEVMNDSAMPTSGAGQPTPTETSNGRAVVTSAADYGLTQAPSVAAYTGNDGTPANGAGDFGAHQPTTDGPLN